MISAPQPIDVRGHILATGQAIMSRKGYSAVGLNELLSAASVPKGSFYHYFPSKDGFGKSLLDAYFEDYVAGMDQLFDRRDLAWADWLLDYFAGWTEAQGSFDCQGKCLAVKLAAEVVDLSEAMRLALARGTSRIVERLAGAIEGGVADGSIRIDGAPRAAAETLYQLWLGASLMAKISRDVARFEGAMTATRRILDLKPA